MMSTSGAKRSPRSDAIRNRSEILRVARVRFRTHGMSASLEAIAKEAGVGPATLYRHFSTREELIAAVLALRDEELAARLAEIDRLEDPAAALKAWRAALEQYFCGYGGLVEPFGQALDVGPSPIATACQWLVSTSDRFLAKAQASGSARPELRGEDIYLAALAAAWASQIAATDPDAVAAVRAVIDRGIATAELAR